MVSGSAGNLQLNDAIVPIVSPSLNEEDGLNTGIGSNKSTFPLLKS